MEKYFSAPDTEQIQYLHETREKDGHATDVEHRSFVAMDLRTTILEELNHPVLKNPSNLALNPDTIWSMNQPIRREDGSVNLTEVVLGSVYREAYQKMEVDTETELCVPFSGYLDQIGITANLRNPT